MIYGNLKELKSYKDLEANLQKCFEYAKENNLLEYATGSYQIDGDTVYVNVAEYETVTREERFWEAHRKYIDIHVMLRGEELVDINFLANMAPGEYVEKDDFLPADGELAATVRLTSGDFLICYPEDVHRTGVRVKDSIALKKVIFKIKVE